VRQCACDKVDNAACTGTGQGSCPSGFTCLGGTCITGTCTGATCTSNPGQTCTLSDCNRCLANQEYNCADEDGNGKVDDLLGFDFINSMDQTGATVGNSTVSGDYRNVIAGDPTQ
jgi:hypothetical protein